MELSLEQKTIIETAETADIVVDSVAGSGKTTTSLHIAEAYPGKRILLITYNKKLKVETREKIRNMDLDNIEAHSYHSFCVKYYNRRCFTDQEMFRVTSDKCTPIQNYLYNMIIVDEMQDMTPLYFKLIKKIVNSLNSPQLILIGDTRQAIYDFNSADERFLIYANELFQRDFVELKLSRSFRMTNQLAEFVNKSLINFDLMCGNGKKGPKPYYYIGNPFSNILPKLQASGFEFTTNMFVIAPSLRSAKTPARQFANMLTKQGIPIYVPVNDNEQINVDVLKGKVIFSTIHQAKGLECDTVILYGFDDSYFKYFKKNSPDWICPNEMYVACTRAKRQLVLIHGTSHDYLPFLDRASLPYTTQIITNGRVRARKGKSNPSTISVTDLVKHIPSHFIKSLIDQLTINQINAVETKISIDTTVDQGDLKENVAEITGTAIPLYYGYRANPFTLLEIYDILGEPAPDNITPSELLRISNLWCACKSGYDFKTVQITDYNWVSQEHLDQCVENLEKYIPLDSTFERKVDEIVCGKQISGYIDCLVDDIIWEFKCVTKLQEEHILQAIVYKEIYHSDTPCYLMNILTREVLEINCDVPFAITTQLVEHKTKSGKKTTDASFLASNMK